MTLMLPSPWREIAQRLRLRPLLPLAGAALVGCALGGPLVDLLNLHSRNPWLWLPVAALAIWWAALYRWIAAHQTGWRRAWVGAGVMVAFGLHLGWQLLPPGGDVAQLVSDEEPEGPWRKLPALVRGEVTERPRQTEAGVEFPLQVNLLRQRGAPQSVSGRIWLTAPADFQAEAGDELEAAILMEALPRAGNPGERELRLQKILRGCWCQAKVPAPGLIKITSRSQPGIIQQLEARVREVPENAAAYQRPHARTFSELQQAMVFGEGGLDKPLPTPQREQFRRAGFSHLLVASGTQVAFLAALLLGCARILGLRRFSMLVVVLPALLLYAVVTGGGPSIWRAAVAGMCLCLATLLGRDHDGISLWALALLVLLILDPLQVFHIGLQLTFGASWGMIAITPWLLRLLSYEHDAGAGVQLAAGTAGAQLGVLPVLLYHFGVIAPFGLLSNMLVLPVAALVVATGMAELVVPAISTFNYALMRWVDAVAHAFAEVPGAQLEFGAPGFGGILLLAAPVALAGILMPEDMPAVWRYEADHAKDWVVSRLAGLTRPSFITGLLVAITLLATYRAWSSREQELQFTMLDVGQGQSLLIQSPGGRAVLVDGGSLSTGGRTAPARLISAALHARGVNKLDAVVITHADGDHTNALDEVLDEVPAAVLLEPPSITVETMRNSADLQDVHEWFDDRKLPTVKVEAGTRIPLGGGAILRAVAPTRPFHPNDNNNSLVLAVEYGATRILITGDIEAEGVESLLKAEVGGRYTLVQVPHHGSRDGSPPSLVSAVKPAAALVSCGRYNQFGHPAPASLAAWREGGARVFRTDNDGAITAVCSPDSCRITTVR